MIIKIILILSNLFLVMNFNFLLNSDKIKSSKIDTNIKIEGKVSNYEWVKSIDNYNYAHCHNGWYGTYVFTEKGTNIKYNIQFKNDIDLKKYENKNIVVTWDKIVEEKEIKIDCDPYLQRPAHLCEEGNDTFVFTCNSIINVEIEN